MAPSSGTLSWGYTKDLASNLTAIPSASAAWTLGSRFAIRSSVAYLQDRVYSPGVELRAGESTPFRRSEFLPLTAGLRFYAGRATEHMRGLFLDASPALYLARVPDDAGGHVFRAAPGVEFGAGIRVPAFQGSRLEIGLSFSHSSPSGSSSLVAPLGPGPGGIVTPELTFYALHIGVGWGD